MAHIALLRGVNLGGHRAVAMADLRQLATALGFSEVRTLLNSGNLVFESGATSADLETLLEAEAHQRLGLRTDFHVRSAEEWRAMIKKNPFPTEAKRDPGRLIMFCLKAAPGAKAFTALQAAIKGPERVLGVGRHAYIYYPDGQGRSTLTIGIIDKALNRGTGRNWNTVLKLAALTASA
ncbi:MAG TPA: DUF1697 domain-containing protein [Gemmatimonadaceae bacterium]|nr:DUF1697 domain-containing protein [Gemmatimonadaceae bacterium]